MRETCTFVVPLRAIAQPEGMRSVRLLVTACALGDSATELVSFTQTQDESPAGITPHVAGFGSDRTFRYRFGWVDVHHAAVDSSTGVRQPIAADVNSLLLVP
jgi:hypothetical protein